MRLFIGIKPESRVLDKIYEVQEELKKIYMPIKYTKKDNIHATVIFLGEVEDSRIIDIEYAMRDICNFPSFGININKTGVFSVEHPRILWIGEYNKNFSNLSKHITEQLNMPVDKEAIFHLTLARIKSIERDILLNLLDFLRKFLNDNILSFVVDRIILFKSTLTRRGAQYSVLNEFKLRRRTKYG